MMTRLAIDSFKSPLRRLTFCLSAMTVCMLSMAANVTYAKGPDSRPVVDGGMTEQPKALAPSGRVSKMTLKQLGAEYPLSLRGSDGRDGVNFNVRVDEIVTQATLKLNYAYSPSMIPELSHINVLVNDEIAASIELTKDSAGTDLERIVNIPSRLITEFNTLSLQLIGHYTNQCEDPLHSSLWAKISNNSVLELISTPIALLNDLAILPLPFMDRRDSRPLKLPIVFATKPDNFALEAAGTIASWFGALSAHRGAHFAAVQGSVPAKGHAIVLIAGKAPALSFEIPAITGPSLALMTNPSDPNGKLLVVMGRDAKELKIAANALTLGSQSLSGPSVVITEVMELAPRKPYDAPNWIPSDRAMSFGELASAKTMNVSGYNPGSIRLNMRVPPDLFGWREKGVPVNLKYRYTPQPTLANSSLTVNINNLFVKSFVLLPIERLGGGDTLLAKVQADDTLPMQGKFQIPLNMLQPQSQIQLRYMYDYIKQGECQDIIIDNVRGAIEPDSTLDISGFSHYLAMPDLSAFSESGFPFTRFADLSQTAVVLPDAPSTQEYSSYLDVLGKMGASTGFPAVAVSVIQAANLATAADKDLIVIATAADQPLLKQWSGLMPGSLEGIRRFSISDLVFKVKDQFSPDPQERIQRARIDLLFRSTSDAGTLSGFESPLTSGRSVVLIWGANPEALADSTNALVGGEGIDQKIYGSFVSVRGKKIDTLVADQTYFVGQLGWFKSIQWAMSRHIGLFILFVAMSTFLLALLIYSLLRVQARRRLKA